MNEIKEINKMGETVRFKCDYSDDVWADILKLEFGITDRSLINRITEITVPYSNFKLILKGEI